MKEAVLQKYYNKYYEQPVFWGTELTEAEKERLLVTLSLIPRDVATILDVGCGDGRITNELGKKFDVTGMDISNEALKHVKTKKQSGSIVNIPFADNAFDLVMATEVLEHVPRDIYNKSIFELQRVAKKYILISVPFKENLYANLSKCQNCGHIFHVFQHLRTFSKRKMLSLFENFEAIDLKIFGPKVGCQNNFLLFLKYRFANKWNYSEKTLCTLCGSKNHPGRCWRNNLLSWLLEGLEWRFNKMFPESFKHGNWVAAVYKKKNNYE